MTTINPSPRTIYLVRHGETQGNIDDKAQGHFDAPLTDLGRRQAKAVAKRLSDTKFDAVYSSDLRRAFETAKAITALQTDLQIRTRPQLREYHFGDYEDTPWENVSHSDPELYKRWKNLSTRIDIEFPGGESMLDAWGRIGDCLSEILSYHREGNEKILIVGHGGSLQALLAHLLEPPSLASMVLHLQQHQRNRPRGASVHPECMANLRVQRHKPPKRHWPASILTPALPLTDNAITITVPGAGYLPRWKTSPITIRTSLTL